MKSTRTTRGSARVFGTPAVSAWEPVADAFAHTPPASSFRRRRDRGPRVAGVCLIFGSALLVATVVSVLAGWVLAALAGVAVLVGFGIYAYRVRSSSSRKRFAAAQEQFRLTRNPLLIPAEARSWAYGALGEELVGKALAGLGREYQVAHDLRVVDSRGRESANIDHVVTGPAGTVMVDSKYWAGVVVPNDRGDSLRREGAGAEGHDLTEKAVDSLAYEARAIPGTVIAIVVAVVGKGSVPGGQVVLAANKNRPMLVAVHSRDLVHTIMWLNAAGSGRRGKSIRRLLRQSGGSLRLSK